MSNEPLAIPSLRIGGIDFQISYEQEVRNKDDQLLYGQIAYEDALIRLTLHPPQIQLATLLHEAVHGILNHAGIHEHDEHLINVISNGIYQMLADNADLLQELTRRRFAQ